MALASRRARLIARLRHFHVEGIERVLGAYALAIADRTRRGFERRAVLDNIVFLPAGPGSDEHWQGDVGAATGKRLLGGRAGHTARIELLTRPIVVGERFDSRRLRLLLTLRADSGNFIQNFDRTGVFGTKIRNDDVVRARSSDFARLVSNGLENVKLRSEWVGFLDRHAPARPIVIEWARFCLRVRIVADAILIFGRQLGAGDFDATVRGFARMQHIRFFVGRYAADLRADLDASKIPVDFRDFHIRSHRRKVFRDRKRSRCVAIADVGQGYRERAFGNARLGAGKFIRAQKWTVRQRNRRALILSAFERRAVLDRLANGAIARLESHRNLKTFPRRNFHCGRRAGHVAAVF